jgi:hypothetical protein
MEKERFYRFFNLKNLIKERKMDVGRGKYGDGGF